MQGEKVKESWVLAEREYRATKHPDMTVLVLFSSILEIPKVQFVKLCPLLWFISRSLLWPQIESHAGSNIQRRGETPLIFDCEEGKRTERSKDENGVVLIFNDLMRFSGFGIRKEEIHTLMEFSYVFERLRTFRTDRKLRLKIPVSHFGHATYENETDRIMQLQPCEWTR